MNWYEISKVAAPMVNDVPPVGYTSIGHTLNPGNELWLIDKNFELFRTPISEIDEEGTYHVGHTNWDVWEWNYSSYIATGRYENENEVVSLVMNSALKKKSFSLYQQMLVRVERLLDEAYNNPTIYNYGV